MQQSYEKRMLRVIAYIYDNPTGDLSLDALADVAAMSRFHWHRVFRAMTGETCATAVKRIRMHLASAALVQTDRPIPEIAASIGYPQMASFSRAFADLYGATPARFRANGQIAPRPMNVTAQEMKMDNVEIRDLPERALLALEHRGAYQEVGRSFQSLFAIIGARGLFGKIGHGVMVCFDDVSSTPVEDLRSYAAVTLTEPLDAPDGLERYDIPAGRAAVLTYTGPYSGLPEAWNAIYCDWLSASDEEMADRPPYEVYLNDPTTTPPDQLVTEIVIPLK